MKDFVLFETPFGSHLYGTATPKSDFDYKIVVLPGFNELIMNGRLTNRVEKPEGWREGDKMIEGAEEREFIPLQVFLDQFFEGQTYALEMSFAVLNDMHTKPHDAGFVKEWMAELVSRFLTRSISKMVGYAVAQSQQYGLKTRRYTAMLKFRELPPAEGKLVSNPELIEEMLKIPYVERSTIMNANGGTEPADAITIAGKQFPLTSKWSHIMKTIEGMISSYGNRVQGHVNQPTDWKALSHAIRIVDQIIELVESKVMTFPRPNSQYLLDVKQGKIEFGEATQYLENRFVMIEAAIEASPLQEKTPELEAEFSAFKLKLLRKYYGLV